MKVQINYDKTNELRNIIWQSHSTWGTEKHRSDPVYCHLKAYNRRIGVESRVIGRVVEHWIVGETLHRIVQDHFPRENIEHLVTRGNTESHIDILWDKPTELKSTRLLVQNIRQIPTEYIDQIRYGLVFLKKKEAYLGILSLSTNNLTVWDVILDKKEYINAEHEFDTQMNVIDYAVMHRDPTVLVPKLDECSDCSYNHSNGCYIWK